MSSDLRAKVRKKNDICKKKGAKKSFIYRNWTDNGPTMHRYWTDVDSIMSR